MISPVLAPLLILAAFCIALAALLVFDLVDRRQTSRLRGFSEAESGAAVFLFENETLLDATPAARQFLETAPRHGTAWAHLAGLLRPHFPTLNDRIRDLGALGLLDIASADGTRRLRAEWHDGIARLTLEDTDDAADDLLDAQSLAALRRELSSLRAVADRTPYPLWREDRSGTICWCNAAYLDLAAGFSKGNDIQSWPPANVFELSEATLLEQPRNDRAARHRLAIAAPGESRRRWYEVIETAPDNGETLFAALPADQLVRAETSLSEFVTTLTKTFASLPIGLAIFDRSRELALFNPALLDLTLLPTGFLISKPTFSAFLDRLRQQKMIPEPKNYKSWRQQMQDMATAAENGTYEETWSLPAGQTYRVTGRPHPDGAVALLFEDISADISLTRRFRAEIELAQSTLDALPQAVAVFTPGGVLALSNHAYATLWGSDPSTGIAELTIADAIRNWQAHCGPGPIWDQLRIFVAGAGTPREGWTATLAPEDGRSLTCRATPLARGASMVAFSQASGESG